MLGAASPHNGPDEGSLSARSGFGRSDRLETFIAVPQAVSDDEQSAWPRADSHDGATEAGASAIWPCAPYSGCRFRCRWRAGCIGGRGNAGSLL